jgi:hypothetical protein
VTYLVLGIALVVGLGLLGYWFIHTEPAKLRRALKWGLIMGALGIAGFVLFRGQMSWLWYAAVILGPMLLRWRAIRRQLNTLNKNAQGPSPGQTSEVRTDYLAMQLDHDTGGMQGEVLEGRFAGRELSSLGLDELLGLLAECDGADPQSVPLLESYIDARHGEEWREDFEHRDHGGRGGGPGAGSGAMTRDQALDILGLQAGASETEIRDAHRRLMIVNHPDKGGSTILAAQINQAKEVLLG